MHHRGVEPMPERARPLRARRLDPRRPHARQPAGPRRAAHCCHHLGAACVGDPAVDLMPAWNLLPPVPRPTYREEVAVDDATGKRGRGWAIAQAATALPYYVHTNVRCTCG